MSINEGLYDGAIPEGYIRIIPHGEMGTVTLKNSCVHAVMQAVEPQLIIDPTGSKPEFFTVIVGLMAGKKFSFRVENPFAEVMAMLSASGYHIDVKDEEFEIPDEKEGAAAPDSN